MAQKENFQAQLDDILQMFNSSASGGTASGNASASENVSASGDVIGKCASAKPTLLLHACCAPCSSYVVEYLAKFFDITIYYYNPNIFPPAEYERRLSELEKFLRDFPESVRTQIKLVKASYNPEEYYEATNVREDVALQTECEKGERCRRCYEFRMAEAYRYAAAHKYDWFCTTLSISPHKDAEKINTIGRKLEAAAVAEASASAAASGVASTNRHVTRWLTSDFKKRGGFKRSLELSAEYDLYRQDYCGCEFSAKGIVA